MAALLGMGLAVSGCSTSGGHTATASPRPTASMTGGATTGPCASVRTTTPIEDVPPACAALWAPYQVTKVPPPDILQQEHVPPAPPVVNMTNGAVSDAVAQSWANASNRDSGWYRWAEANDQLSFLRYLVGPAVIAKNEEQALSAGATISLPDCDLYPINNALYSITAQDQAYFARKNLPTDNHFVFVVVYEGPCSERISYPGGGPATTYSISSSPHTVFVPGRLVADSLLGNLWFSDAGGNCDDPIGPPPEWCQR